MSCKYCKNWGTKISQLDLGDIILVCCYYTEVGDGRDGILRIKFCPNCGRKLVEDE